MARSKNKSRKYFMVHGRGPTKYSYRNLPCVGNDYYIGGKSSNGSGILEWCVDEEDARAMFERMSRYAEFHDLRIGRTSDDNPITDVVLSVDKNTTGLLKIENWQTPVQVPSFSDLRHMWALKAVVTDYDIDVIQRLDSLANPYNEAGKPRLRSRNEIIADLSHSFADTVLLRSVGQPYRKWLDRNFTCRNGMWFPKVP